MPSKKKLARLRAKYPELSLHHLYEASVQNVDADVDFIERVWRETRGGAPRTLREDFCGTASLCAEFVRRHERRRAWGVDLDGATLEWGRNHRLALLTPAAAERVVLEQRDVREVKEPRVDVQVAFNFSYFGFHDRDTLRGYFESVYASLGDRGMFLMDLFGGVESEQELEEETVHEAQVDPDGTEIPAFSYLWDQDRLNAIDRSLRCYIHFKVPRVGRVRKAFTYEWRFWTLPELRELLVEAGFRESTVYVEGWDDDEDEPDGDYQATDHLDNEGGYVAYLVAER